MTELTPIAFIDWSGRKSLKYQFGMPSLCKNIDFSIREIHNIQITKI